MIGLLYILFFLLYGFISSKVVRWTIAWAKGKNKNPKLWGILAGLVMFSLVFWDLIPTYAAHRY
ncbi:MAG TPA: hypothetical protein EYH06_12900 [Chromatiales bacterium]|nr:hypothetical protein [Chromatiales bacterium]